MSSFVYLNASSLKIFYAFMRISDVFKKKIMPFLAYEKRGVTPEVINIDYNFQLKKILDEFFRSNQVAFDGFGVECSNLVKRENACEKLVESEIEHCAIVVEEEDLKNKVNGTRRVNHFDIYVTFESQPMELKERNHLPNKHQSSPRWESPYSKALVIGAWEHLILYAKFMDFLPNKRKKNDDMFFLTYMPP
jgi:hypothetical protein